MTHNLTPFIVESLRRSRPFIVVATFLSVLLFAPSVSAQTTPFTVFNETFESYATGSLGSNAVPPWISGTTWVTTTVSGNKRIFRNSTTASVGYLGARSSGLSVSNGYQRLFFDHTFVSGTQPDNIRYGLTDATGGNINDGDENCSLWVTNTGNPLLKGGINESATTLYNPALGTVLTNGNTGRYFLDLDSDGHRCRIGVVTASLSYFSDWVDVATWYDNPITRVFIFKSTLVAGTGQIGIDNVVYQIAGSAFPASGTSITTIGDSLVIPAGDYLQVNYPTNGTITASTTITLDIDYTLPIERAYLNKMLGSFCSQVEQLNGLPDCEHYTLSSSLTIGSPTTITPSVTLDYEGAYVGFISFWNGVEEDVECSWFDVWCDDTAQELWETQSISFSSASTTVMLVTPYYRENLINMCDQLPLGADYICEAMVWLFVPSTDVYVNATNQVWNQMAGKIPFGFFIYAKDTLSNVVQSPATSTYEGITVDLTVLGGETAIFDVQAVKNDEFYQRLMNTLDPYAEIFIWFFFLAYIWHRFKGSHFEPPAEDNLWGV